MQKKIKQYIGVIVFSITLFLIALELCLRLMGWVYATYIVDHGVVDGLINENAIIVMCIGESTTQDQWPNYLESELLKYDTSREFVIIDKGFGGVDSEYIAGHIDAWLDEYHPDIVVGMMGVNDTIHTLPFDGSRLYLKFTTQIRQLRLFKFYRLISERIVALIAHASIFVDTVNASEDDLAVDAPLDDIIANMPYDDISAAMWPGYTLIKYGRHDDASTYLKHVREAYPHEDEPSNGLGWLYANEQETALALYYFKDAIKRDPSDGCNYVNLGLFFQKTGQVSRVDALIQKIEERDPTCSRRFFLSGSQYFCRGLYSMAKIDLARFVEFAKDKNSMYDECVHAVKLLADMYCMDNDFLQAEKILNLMPETEMRLIVSRSVLLERTGRRKLSAQLLIENFHSLREVLNGNEFSRVLFRYLELLAIEEKYLVAIDVLMKYGDEIVSPESYNIVTLIGVLNGKLSIASEAEDKETIREIRKVRELLDDIFNDYNVRYNAPVSIMKGRQNGEMFLLSGDYENATQVYRNMYNTYLAEYNIAGSLGLCLRLQGNVDEAQLYFKKHLKIKNKRSGSALIQNYKSVLASVARHKAIYVAMTYPLRDASTLFPVLGMINTEVNVIDNDVVFEEALNELPYGALFVDVFAGDFGHCTDEGNRLIAQNVAKVLFEQVIPSL